MMFSVGETSLKYHVLVDPETTFLHWLICKLEQLNSHEANIQQEVPLNKNPSLISENKDVLHCSKWKLSSESHLDSAAIEI
jgi:hypothetical protein